MCKTNRSGIGKAILKKNKEGRLRLPYLQVNYKFIAIKAA
jgi:hypothetical protein